MAALTDEDLERMAMEEILKESKRNAERAKEFGSLGWQNPGKSTNKRFLSNMLVSTLRNPLQKSRFNETHSSDSERSDGRKKRRHSKEDRRRNSSERYSKSYQDEREKNVSESSYTRKNVRETYDPHSRRFSGNRQSYEDSRRKYQKSNSRNHKANERSSFQRGGSLEEDEDIYHEDYMEYIQNYKKHMNYYEKMEECMQEKYTRSYHSVEGRSLHNEARMEEKCEELKKASKTKQKRSWSDSNEFLGSDFSECEKKSKTRNHSISLTRKKKSKHKRKGFRENDSKTKKEKNSTVDKTGDSEDVNSPEGAVSVGDGLDSKTCDVLKGNNSELCNIKSSQEEKKSQKKQTKHKKHKHKKHKKVKESINE